MASRIVMTPPVALVLAGSRGEADAVAAYAGVTDKALIELGGQTMLTRVVAAVRAAGIRRIAVSAAGDVCAAALRSGAEALAAAEGPSASTAAAMEALGTPMIVTTGDHALLRPEWISDFLARAPADADVAVLLARREAVERAAPGSSRTYLRFADGHWSGCNLFLLATPRAMSAVRLWQTIERDRKRPWRIVRRLGLVLLLRYVLGRLTLAEAVGALGRRAGVTAAIVACPDGLAAVDVDTPSDLDFVRSRLG